MPLTTLSSYLSTSFNLTFLPVLAISCTLSTRSPLFLLALILLISILIPIYDTTSTLPSLIKKTLLLPLGLGSILSYLSLPSYIQARHLTAFTKYISFAVYANIGIMIFTPHAGTFRGKCSKLTCLALFIWIVLLGYRAGWQTVVLHDHNQTQNRSQSNKPRNHKQAQNKQSKIHNILTFTSPTLPWILTHALYRSILLTLPIFTSSGQHRYRYLELYSLAFTVYLSKVTGLRVQDCFGMADSLVVPVVSAWGGLVDCFGLTEGKGVGKAYGDRGGVIRGDEIGKRMDFGLGVVELGLGVYVCWMIWVLVRSGRGGGSVKVK